MASVQKNRIIFDESDWLAGMNPAFNDTPTGIPVPLKGNMLSYTRSFNPFRTLGYASPGFEPANVTNTSVVTLTAIRSILLSSESGTSYGYGVNSSARLFQLASNTGALTNSGVWPHTITAASGAVSGNDTITYSAKVGGTRATRLFYSYQRIAGNAWDVGMYELDGATFDDDFMSTAPLNSTTIGSPFTGESDPHPMIVGDDDVLYIGNGNLLYGYDGSAAVDPNGELFLALTLPEGFRIQTFARLNHRLMIFGSFPADPTSTLNTANYYTRSVVYYWDYLSLDPYDADDLSDNLVACAFQYKDTVGVFTQGRRPTANSNQVSKLQIYNGSRFETVTMFDKNVPFNQAVDVIGDTIMWNSQGTIFLWGSPYVGVQSGLYKIAEGTGSDSGAIRTINTTTQVISTGTGSGGGLQTLESGYSDQVFVTSQLVSPSWGEGKMGKVQSVKVEFAATASGGRDVSVYLVGNNFGTVQVFANIATIDSSNITKTFYYDVSGVKGPAFTDLAVSIGWDTGSGSSDAPVIKRVQVEFETVNETSILT